MLQSKHKRVQFCWVPSHVGVIGNEQVDKLAKEAAMAVGESAYVISLQILLYHYKDGGNQKME